MKFSVQPILNESVSRHAAWRNTGTLGKLRSSFNVIISERTFLGDTRVTVRSLAPEN